MVKHIVFWKFQDHADDYSKEENIKRVADALNALPAKISLIKVYEVGINVVDSDASWDLSLTSGFDSFEDLKTYAAIPDHQEVGKLIGKVVMDRVVVDYEV